MTHTGEHLASLAADCVQRFGLEDKVIWNITMVQWLWLIYSWQLHVICMDNAGNCNTMVEHLSGLIPGFRGTESRTQCFPC